MVQPLVGRWGGKSRIADWIVKHFPEHDTYVEPLVGGGSVFLTKAPAKKEVIGDNDPSIISVFRVARTEGKACDITVRSQQGLRDLVKKPRKSDCEQYALLRCSFASMGRDPSAKYKFPCKAVFNPKPEVRERLRRTLFIPGDFRKSKRYDSPRTLFYLDPLYHKVSNDGYHGPSLATPQAVAGFVRTLKGKYVVSMNNTPETRKMFCRFKDVKCFTKDKLNSGCSKSFGGCGVTKELLAVRR